MILCDFYSKLESGQNCFSYLMKICQKIGRGNNKHEMTNDGKIEKGGYSDSKEYSYFQILDFGNPVHYIMYNRNSLYIASRNPEGDLIIDKIKGSAEKCKTVNLGKLKDVRGMVPNKNELNSIFLIFEDDSDLYIALLKETDTFEELKKKDYISKNFEISKIKENKNESETTSSKMFKVTLKTRKEVQIQQISTVSDDYCLLIKYRTPEMPEGEYRIDYYIINEIVEYETTNLNSGILRETIFGTDSVLPSSTTPVNKFFIGDIKKTIRGDTNHNLYDVRNELVNGITIDYPFGLVCDYEG